MALTNTQLATELYIAYFNRAPDPVGLNVWVNALNNGQTLDTAANLFANSTEAQTLYPFLALHVAPDPGTAAGFVNSVYENLLNRVPDADGATYWTNLLTTGKITVGQFIVDVVESVNMQTGTADATTLANKVAVGDFYANLAASLNATPSQAAEVAAIAGVTADPATVTAAEARITTNTAHNTFTLTAGADVISDPSGIGHDVVNAPLVVGASGQSQSLSVGDSITLTGDNNIANITLGGTIGAVWPAGSTISGAQTVNFQNVGDVLPIPGLIPALIPGNDIVGMTTANMVNSAASVLIGGNLAGLGATGLPTLLTTVGMTNTGVQTFGLEIQNSVLAAATAPALTVNLSGVGANTGAMNNAPNTFVSKVFLKNGPLVGAQTQDGSLWIGSDAVANPAYTSMNFNVTGNNALQLGTFGSNSLTTITIAGAGGLLLDGTSLALPNPSMEGAKVSTITSTASGNVIITGGSENTGNNPSPLGILPIIGTNRGFLAADQALTSVTTGAGNDWVDVSSMSLATVGANKLAVDLGTGTNELVVDASVATSATALTFFNNVQVLGVAANDGVVGVSGTASLGLNGTINVANLPTSVNEIQLVGGPLEVTGDLIINKIGNNFTVDVLNAFQGSNHNLTLNSTTPGSTFTTTLDIGLPEPLTGVGTPHSALHNVAINGFATVNLNSFGDGLPVSGANTMDGLLVDNTPGGGVTLNIAGTDALTISQGVLPNGEALALAGNGTFIVDTDLGAVTIGGNTVAGSINAATSGGWLMGGADLFHVGTIGVSETGSSTAFNQLAGSLGNDILVSGNGIDPAVAGAGDQLFTMGGADAISLTAGHTGQITIDLFDTFTGTAATDGLVGSSHLDTITIDAVAGQANVVNSGGVVVVPVANDLLGQQGFWGAAPGQSVDLTQSGTFGTSADQSTVSNFHTGKTGDILNLAADSWTHSGAVNLGLNDVNGNTVNAGTATHLEFIGSGGVLGLGGDALANVTVLTGVTYANAAALASSLLNGSTGIHIGTAYATANNQSADFIAAYQDAAGNTHVADVNLIFNGPVAAGSLLASDVSAVHVSDMVQLTGVAAATLDAHNIAFV